MTDAHGSDYARRFPCRGAEADSRGLAVQKTTVIPQLLFLDKVIEALLCGSCWFFLCRSHARCVQRQVPGYVSQLQFFNKVVHIPVEVQRLSHDPDCCRTKEIPLMLWTK